MSLLPGVQLGPYEIVSQLGAGGMGEVYRARDTKLKRDVAIKVLPPSLATDADALSRFEREALAVAALSHSNILAIHDFGSHEGVTYAVMELLEGETLRDTLVSGAIPQRKSLLLAREIAEGLAAAHERGIAHRDLKPENVFITKDGHVKILDFGLAKQTPAPGDDVTSAPTARRQTEPGTVMGTVGYMSPEQVRGHPADSRSDIFSFGAVLFEMLTGKRAFKGDSAVETMNAILTGEPAELSRTSPGFPPSLERLVQHCLEKRPEQRFQSARDLAFGLETLSSDSLPGRVAVTSAAPGRGRRFAVPAMALALLAAGILLGRTVLRSALPSSPSFRQITFRRGTVCSARFAPDGSTIVYTARWDGKAAEAFSVRVDSPESRPLGVASALVLSISSAGEMAMLVGASHVQHLQFAGTLSRAPIGGGAPREIQENVVDADWAPDGSQLAIVRVTAAGQQLEFPAGKALYVTAGWISHPRISPRGDLIAFLDHPIAQDDRGSVAVVDLKGGKKILSEGWEALEGLAWSPGGEVWFTGARSGSVFALHAVTLSGRLRLVYNGASSLNLLDISRSGQVLLSSGTKRETVMGLAAGDTKERDLSWLDFSIPSDISDDGKTLLFNEESAAVGSAYAVCIRKMDGSAVVRLGEGTTMALSPDGKWVLSAHPDSRQISLLPTGAGEARRLGEEISCTFTGGFLPDGKRIVFFGTEAGRPERLYVQDLAGGKPRPIAPEGTRASLQNVGTIAPVSPDGKLVAARGPDQTVSMYPVDGGTPRPIPGLLPGDGVIRWKADGHAVYVWEKGDLPVRIFKVDVATGRREPWKELAPEDRAGAIQTYSVCLTPDGKSYAYDCQRVLSDLFEVDGLK